MYEQFKDKNGKSAEKLKGKIEREEEKLRNDLNVLIERVSTLEDNYEKISSKLDEVEKLILHKDNNYQQSSKTTLEILMQIQDKLGI